ncbi:hypothetical protein [Pseudomaricurvus sp.]|uniref:hypothetical protein n=1 Tax=Pseudomaricurvus sp. TaxID=2004510 RepID=UPI003F6D81AE
MAKINVKHYWAKTVESRYGSEYQQLAIELTITAILLPITFYSWFTPGLGLFFVGFLVPTISFALGSILTIYFMIKNRKELRRESDKEKGGST